jgi:hypothetical protein
MPSSAIIIRDGDDSHRLLITHRDWMVLWGPQFGEGPSFSTAFGVYDNYTVWGGVPKGSHVKRRGNALYDTTNALFIGVKRDYELFRFDYSYKFANGPKSCGGGQGIRVGGRTAILSLRPKGYCSITILDGSVSPPRVAEVIDLRTMKTVETDSGLVKVYRRKAETYWLETLPPLLKFLASRREKDLVVEHIERPK